MRKLYLLISMPKVLFMSITMHENKIKKFK
jgi:hypothetical protein